MAEARIVIGRVDISIAGDGGVAQAMSLPGMCEFRNGEADAKLLWLLDQPLQRPHCRLLHSFSIVDGQRQCRFGIDGEGVYYYDFDGDGLLRYDARQPSRVEISPVRDPSILRFALWTAMSMSGLSVGAAPVHSSVVVCDGRGVMCLGESGTGKSTHTRLWMENIAGTYLLNDDSPILRATADNLWVCGSPWSGKTPCYKQQCLPVAALLRLEQRKENSIRRLRTIEAFAALQPSCPPSLAHDERCLDELVGFISQVLQRTPTYRMGCLPDAAAAHLSHDTIYNTKD